MRIRPLFFIGLSLAILGCSTANKPAESPDGEILETQTVTMPMKTGKTLVDPEHGARVSLWYGAVGGEEGVNASGVAFTHKFDDGTFVHTTNLNIAQLKTGAYVAWVAKDESGRDARLMGEVRNIVGDARHAVRFETKDDLESSVYLIVTQETSKTPAKPGKVVARGILKPTNP